MITFFTIIFSIFIIYTIFYFSNLENNYYKEKKDILRIFSSFLSDIKVDKNDNNINPINIENTKNNIIHFSNRLIKIQKMYFRLKFFLKNKQLIENEWKYIFELTNMFNDWLNNWIEFHKKELWYLENSIWEQEKNTKNISFKNTLELQRKRIDFYRNKI